MNKFERKISERIRQIKHSRIQRSFDLGCSLYTGLSMRQIRIFLRKFYKNQK